jgi:hypothetical protein
VCRKEAEMLTHEIAKEMSASERQEKALRVRTEALVEREERVRIRELEAEALKLQVQERLDTYKSLLDMEEREHILAERVQQLMAREVEVERLAALAQQERQQAAEAADKVAQREQWLEEGEKVLMECARHLQAPGSRGKDSSEEALRKRAAGVTAQKAVRRWITRSTGLAWSQWRHAVLMGRIAKRVVARWMRQQVWAAWVTWKAVTRERTRQHALVRAAGEVWVEMDRFLVLIRVLRRWGWSAGVVIRAKAMRRRGKLRHKTLMCLSSIREWKSLVASIRSFEKGFEAAGFLPSYTRHAATPGILTQGEGLKSIVRASF